MKNTLPFIIIMMFLSLGMMTQQHTTTDFVVLTPKIEQLEPILLAAQGLKTEGDFKIVLYGKEVTQLTNPEFQKFIEWAEKANVRLAVCQMSLNLLKINPTTIPREIEIVDNAFLHTFQLQKKGYKV